MEERATEEQPPKPQAVVWRKATQRGDNPQGLLDALAEQKELLGCQRHKAVVTWCHGTTSDNVQVYVD